MTNNSSEGHSTLTSTDLAAAQWAMELLEGPLSAERRRAYLDWLEAAPENQARLDQTFAFLDAFDSSAAEPELILHRQKALDLYRKAQAGRWQRPARPFLRMAIAASIALALTAAGTVWFQAQPIVYKTEIGERRAVVLTDGSRLSLDADTRVAVRYRAHSRELTLSQGRAVFAVAKDASRPFSVQSGDKRVIATGTEFSVEKLSDEIVVALYQGHIKVRQLTRRSDIPQLAAIDGKTLPVEANLSPGQQVRLPAQSQTLAQITQQGPVAPRAWETGLLEFSGEPLETAVERVNRYVTGKPIEVTPDVAHLPVDGVFYADDPKAFLAGIRAVYPVDVSDTPTHIVISKK